MQERPQRVHLSHRLRNTEICDGTEKLKYVGLSQTVIETGKDVKTARIGEMSRALDSVAAHCRLPYMKASSHRKGLDKPGTNYDSAMIRSSESFEIGFLEKAYLGRSLERSRSFIG